MKNGSKGVTIMKKAGFIITQTILSLILTASVGSAVVLTMDIRSGGKILPQELFHTQAKSKNTQNQNSGTVNEAKTSKEESKTEESSKPVQESKTESRQESKAESKPAQESEKPEESQKAEESKKPEESKADSNGLNLILEEPKNLKENPKELIKIVEDYGYGSDFLGFDNLILVDVGEKSTAKVYCYQKSSKDIWWNIAGDGKTITDKAFIGSGGADFDIKNGSKKTPLGFYSISEGFYIGEKPHTTFPLFEITDDVYWVTDTKSKYYNQKVDSTVKKDWTAADHMIDDKDAKKYGLVVEFNTSSPDGKLAPEIFVRCGTAPTQGSIALPENIMKAILEWLSADGSTYIFIAP